MSMSVSLPLDNDGFLRRECPNCEREFKWHNGPANEEAETADVPVTYYCPLCGEPAPPDHWWTTAQLDYMQEMATPMIMRQVSDVLGDALRGSKHVTYKAGDGSDLPDPPSALSEPDDMRIVASPCHDYEPVKVPDDADGPLHCLVCGSAFAV
ncbi:hypothetical protein GCM10023328_47500 [Modestobacter marinus]|uniref:Uncharacterized protein n=1 Tax=Modestobacter marinus TaxID=477641 RepID=A0ABQ2GC78_9ACTN|nr:hypothetical protein [Modestobacter marinus]GGL85083.1 hypothetical protein GCM10011589_46890 [Modestobacter marinus]